MGEDVSVVTLMYHAIYRGEAEWRALEPEERPYAIARSEFEQQLDTLATAGIPVIDPAELFQRSGEDWPDRGVLITFDDGHASFYEHAYPALKERNLRALFFITSDLIDQRDDFCHWQQLVEMAQVGQWIQAHGKTHRFLSDLSPEDLTEECVSSMHAISAHTGQPVVAMSFPGGRFNKRELDQARLAGYSYLFGSRIGTLNRKPLPDKVWPRIAIRQNTSLRSFLALARGRRTAIAPHQIKDRIKSAIKRLLGNRIYHGLYQRLSA
jgi:peptidoglycan/xylan/chitin deacetylase (PgdA/CDA1 family)